VISSLTLLLAIFYRGLGQLSQGGVTMGGFGQSIGQLNQGSALTSSLNSGLPITSTMSSNGSTVYQAHYGLNSLGKSIYTHPKEFRVEIFTP
jgi:hypothetical protein